MSRRVFVFICLLLAVFLSAVLTGAQQAKRVFRIGILSAGASHDATYTSRHAAFRQALTQLGYVEGKNIVIEERFAEGKLDRLPALVAEFVRSKVDVIVAGGTAGIMAAKKATSAIPIVMAHTGDDPVRAGLVASHAQPGGNITGLSSMSSELAGKRLELLKEAVPKISRVAFLRDPASPGSVLALKETQAAAQALKVKLQAIEAASRDEFEKAFRSAVDARTGAIIIQSGGLFTTHQMRLISLAAQHRLPAMYTEQYFVSAGGLMAYATNMLDLFTRAAWYVDRILKGAKPAELPVEQPTRFDLIINLKAAKQIGLTIPPNVLVRADRVIK